MAQQTAIEWLTEKLSKYELSVTEKGGRVWNYGKINDSTYVASLFERAKAMEQEQIEEAYMADRKDCLGEDARYYYVDTFITP